MTVKTKGDGPAGSTLFFEPGRSLVEEFHKAMRLPLAGIGGSSVAFERQLRGLGELVHEEAEELQESVFDNDPANAVKEVADVVYSSLGLLVALPLRVDDEFLEIAAMEKARAERLQEAKGLARSRPTVVPRKYRESVLGQATEEVARVYFVSAVRAPATVNLRARGGSRTPNGITYRIRDAAVTVRKSLERRDHEQVTRSIAKILYHSIYLALATGMPFEQAFRDVHDNNMTKSPRSRRGVAQKPGKGAGYEELDLTALIERGKRDGRR